MHANVDRFLIPDAFDTEGNFERIRSIMARFPEVDQRATLHASIDAADFSTGLNWSAIYKLARILFDLGQMDEEELSAWFVEHPASPCQVELRLIS